MARHASPHDDRPDSNGASGRRRFGGRGHPRREEYSVAGLFGQPEKGSATPPNRRRIGMAFGGLLAVGSLTAVAMHVDLGSGFTDSRDAAPGAVPSGGPRPVDTATPPNTSSALPPLGASSPPSAGPASPPLALPNALPSRAPTPGADTPPRVGDPGLSPVGLLRAPRRPTTVPVSSTAARSGQHHPAAGRSTRDDEDRTVGRDDSAEGDSSDDSSRDDADQGVVGDLAQGVSSSAGTALSSLTGPLG